MAGVAILWLFSEPQARQAGEQDRQSGRHLEPRERRADAEMNPGAECASARIAA